jgi:hypothetical protein
MKENLKLCPEIEAEILILPEEDSPRKKPIRCYKAGYFGCPMVLPSGNWDCRMFFPDSGSEVALGETARALIQFLSPHEVLQQIQVGDSFELWEMGIFARGIITKILKHQSGSTRKKQ